MEGNAEDDADRKMIVMTKVGTMMNVRTGGLARDGAMMDEDSTSL